MRPSQYRPFHSAGAFAGGPRRPSPHETSPHDLYEFLSLHYLGNARCWRRVAAALDADCAIGDDHADSWQVSFLNAVEEILTGGLLGCVEEDEARFAARSDQTAAQAAHLGRIAGSEADCLLCRNPSERRQH